MKSRSYTHLRYAQQHDSACLQESHVGDYDDFDCRVCSRQAQSSQGHNMHLAIELKGKDCCNRQPTHGQKSHASKTPQASERAELDDSQTTSRKIAQNAQCKMYAWPA